MKKVDIILRTSFTIFYFVMIMFYIDQQIEKGEWLSFFSGASALALCVAIANHVRHLIRDEVKKDGDGDAD